MEMGSSDRPIDPVLNCLAVNVKGVTGATRKWMGDNEINQGWQDRFKHYGNMSERFGSLD